MKNIEKYIIVVLSFIAVGAIGTAVYFGVNNKQLKEQNKVNEVDKQDANESNTSDSFYFYDMKDIEVNYATELKEYNCKIDLNGFLIGDCAIEELKNTKFTNLMPRSNDGYNERIQLLDVEGYIYSVNINSSDNNKIILVGQPSKREEYWNEKNITKMGYIKNYDWPGSYYEIYMIDDEEYIIDVSTGDVEGYTWITLSEARENNMPVFSVTPSKIFIDTWVSINKTLLINNKIVKNVENKENVIIKYLLYKNLDDKESLHIISNDNKYYIMNNQSEFVSEEANIKKTDLRDNELIITLEDSREVSFLLTQ